MLKRTALFEEHRRLGGKLIDFGGWQLPVQYSGVMDEHLACRTTAGLFDVSHMGEFHVEGKDAEAFLNFLVAHDVARISTGQAQYTVLCDDGGGIVDDLVLYRRSPDRFLVVVNASNTEKDFDHFQEIKARFRGATGDLRISNESSRYTQIAIQGRNSQEITRRLTESDLASIRYYGFTEGRLLGSIPALIARTGYTGEDGFELYVPWDSGPEVWRALLEAGTPLGLKPCGLGARDTLRLEMKYPLYGNELSHATNPLEAGLGWVVKLDKEDFIGKGPILNLKAKGLSRKLVGLKLLDRGIPRHGYGVFTEDGQTRIGEITSGTQSPMLRQAIGIAYVAIPQAKEGSRITVDIRGGKIPAEVVPTPFYKRPY